MFKDIETLRQEIRTFGLQRHEEKILELAKPAIRMLPSRVDDAEIPIGSSKLGGMPDLPPNFQWKYYGGKPLTFIGQFKLSELAAHDVNKELPETGILYFFFEADEMEVEAKVWQIFFIEDENTKLERRIHPEHEGIYNSIKALPAHRLIFENSFCLPRIFINECKNYGLEYDDFSLYNKFYHPDSREAFHYFLAYPQIIDDPVEWDCVVQSNAIKPLIIEGSKYPRFTQEQRISIMEEMKNWKFLFQIDSDNSLDVLWGDMGMLYICIPKASLISRRFEDCWIMLQCH